VAPIGRGITLPVQSWVESQEGGIEFRRREGQNGQARGPCESDGTEVKLQCDDRGGGASGEGAIQRGEEQ
jgi:hypothetical protein